MTRIARTPSLARRIVAPALLALSLFTGVVAATPAEARVNGPALDSFSAGCLALQNRGDALRAEYLAVATANPNSPRLDAIIAELRNIGATWRQIGCQSVFGSIVLLVRPVGGDHLADIGDVAVLEPEPTAAPGYVRGVVGAKPGLVQR